MDTDGDGKLDTWMSVVNGQITRLARDTDHDGKPDFTTTFSAGEGQPLADVQYKPGTEQIVSKTEYEQGVTSKREADDNGDGKPDHWWYHAGGRLAKEARDTDGDGKIDEMKLYRDEKVVRIEYDVNHNGKFDKADVMENGRRVRTEITDNNGALVLFYDGTGTKVARRERDSNDDGRPDIIVALDPATGVVLREDRDLNGDGRPDVSAYFEKGKVVRREISGEYLRAQQKPSALTPSVSPETRDFRKVPGG
ncbi:MAG: hypothetical protein A2Y95_06635 [Deltaproteobacteria bacterium RBG_13_65_10]|nr:MAG: hypothetical protein A2Y95_06635 [Deltaproteobacteria bacterium RBG_13_65_10]